jgi:hypothetical protein
MRVTIDFGEEFGDKDIHFTPEESELHGDLIMTRLMEWSNNFPSDHPAVSFSTDSLSIEYWTPTRPAPAEEIGGKCRICALADEAAPLILLELGAWLRYSLKHVVDKEN